MSNYIQNLIDDGKIKEIFAESNSQKTSLNENNISQNNNKINSNDILSINNNTQNNIKYSLSNKEVQNTSFSLEQRVSGDILLDA